PPGKAISTVRKRKRNCAERKGDRTEGKPDFAAAKQGAQPEYMDRYHRRRLADRVQPGRLSIQSVSQLKKKNVHHAPAERDRRAQSHDERRGKRAKADRHRPPR